MTQRIFLLLLAVGSLEAQGSEFNATDQTSSSPNDPLEWMPSSPNDSDLGNQIILGDISNHQQGKFGDFKVDISQGVYWSNTVQYRLLALSFDCEEHLNEDFYYTAGLNLDWEKYIAEQFWIESSVSQDLYRFNKTEESNFEYFTAGIGIMKVIPQWKDIVLFTRYEYERVTQENIDDTVWDAHSIRWGGTAPILKTRGHDIQLQLDVLWTFKQREGNGIEEYSTRMQDRWRIHDQVLFTPFCEFRYTEYPDASVTSYSFGTEITWALNSHIEINANFAYEANHSSSNSVIYNSEGIITGVNLSLEF